MNREIRHKISFCLRKLSNAFFSLIPKKKNLVLCNAWFGQKYADNPMYVYEYLLKNSKYNLYWLTSNKKIFEELHKKGLPVVKAHSLKGYWLQIRAQACFSTVQFSEYNQWIMSNTIYIDLGHGHPIKDPGHVSDFAKGRREIEHWFTKKLRYYAIVASDFAKEKYQDVVTMDPNHIIVSDFARNDVFVDSTLRVGKNLIVEKYKEGGKKAIVYMPTHRSDGRKPMILSEILPLDAIQKMCEKYGYVFIIKKHFYHRNEVEDLSMYNRIFDITNIDDIDPQVLLFQTDVLISDYSACYIDYLLLDRPMLFFQYDIEEFQKSERSLYIPFSKLDIAPIAYTKPDFITELETLMKSEDDMFSVKRRSFTPTYFANTGQLNGREKVKDILDSLMNKHY